MAVVISDASPLVHLGAIGRFDLLRHLYAALLVPPAVWQEVAVVGQGRPGAAELSEAVKEAWIELKAPSASILKRQELAAWTQVKPKRSRWPSRSMPSLFCLMSCAGVPWPGDSASGRWELLECCWKRNVVVLSTA